MKYVRVMLDHTAGKDNAITENARHARTANDFMVSREFRLRKTPILFKLNET